MGRQYKAATAINKPDGKGKGENGNEGRDEGWQLTALAASTRSQTLPGIMALPAETRAHKTQEDVPLTTFGKWLKSGRPPPPCPFTRTSQAVVPALGPYIKLGADT